MYAQLGLPDLLSPIVYKVVACHFRSMQPWRAVILARDPAPVVHREHATPRLLLKLLLNKIYRNLAISIKYTRLWYVCIKVQVKNYRRVKYDFNAAVGNSHAIIDYTARRAEYS